MFKNNRYFIKIQRDCSLVKNNGRTIKLSFDRNDSTALKFESQISDFQSFEEQLKDGLKKLNYRTGAWKKNIFYFSIPNGLDEVQKRCYFDSADHLDASETYLLHENIAILLNPGFREETDKVLMFIGIFKSKVEISVVRSLRFLEQKTFYFDREISFYGSKEVFLKYIDNFSKQYQIDEFWVTNEQEDDDVLKNIAEYKILHERDKLILSGLELAANKDFGAMIRRFGL